MNLGLVGVISSKCCANPITWIKNGYDIDNVYYQHTEIA